MLVIHYVSSGLGRTETKKVIQALKLGVWLKTTANSTGETTSLLYKADINNTLYSIKLFPRQFCLAQNSAFLHYYISMIM